MNIKSFYRSLIRGEIHASFIIDPFILIICAFLAVYFSVRYFYKMWPDRKEKIIPVLSALVILIVWAGALGFYFDVINLKFLFGDYGAGNHFMWHSLIDYFKGEPITQGVPSYADFWNLKNISALAFMLIGYPIIYKVGLILGYIFFGRNENQTGLVGLL